MTRKISINLLVLFVFNIQLLVKMDPRQMDKCLRMASVIFGNVNYMVNLDGKLVGDLETNLDENFDPSSFGSLEIRMEIYFGNFDGNLVWKISWKFR